MSKMKKGTELCGTQSKQSQLFKRAYVRRLCCVRVCSVRSPFDKIL